MGGVDAKLGPLPVVLSARKARSASPIRTCRSRSRSQGRGAFAYTIAPAEGIAHGRRALRTAEGPVLRPAPRA